MRSEQGAAWIAQRLAAEFALVMESMTGLRPAIACSGTPETTPEVPWLKYSLTISPAASVWFGASKEVRSRLGEEILKAAGIEEPDTASIENTFEEAAGQAAGGLTRALSALLRQPVSSMRQAGGPPDEFAACFLASIVCGEASEGLPLWLAVSPDTAALAAPSEAASELAGPSSGKSLTPSPSDRQLRKMDLLLDVQLPVSVSFGQSQLPLRDVIKLTTGSIVELNRTISEPVEVLVNNCVIARGEVVVVEGNFGVRIQQVVSRQERLRSIE